MLIVIHKVTAGWSTLHVHCTCTSGLWCRPKQHYIAHRSVCVCMPCMAS